MGLSLTPHRTLLLEPLTRGLPPATSSSANKKATALPWAPIAHGPGQGDPFATVQPPCDHCGGSASVRTVPAQPPAKVCTGALGRALAWGVCCDELQPAVRSRHNAAIPAVALRFIPPLQRPPGERSPATRRENPHHAIKSKVYML